MTARGGHLERFLEDYHKAIRGRALIERTSAEVRQVHDKAKGTTKFIATRSSGRPDFMGTVRVEGLALGIPVAMDAKEEADSSWPLANLAENQAAWLSHYERAGGVAMIFLRIRGRDFLIFWQDIAERWRMSCATSSFQGKGLIGTPMRGMKSLSLDELPSLGRPVGHRGWLDVFLPLPAPRSSP